MKKAGLENHLLIFSFQFYRACDAASWIRAATSLGHSFGNRVKFSHLTPEPKPISVGIVALKGKLSPAAEKFWQCAKEACVNKMIPIARPANSRGFAGGAQEVSARLGYYNARNESRMAAGTKRIVLSVRKNLRPNDRGAGIKRG